LRVFCHIYHRFERVGAVVAIAFTRPDAILGRRRAQRWLTFAIAIAMLSLGVSGRTGAASAQSPSPIVVEGNRRIEADTIRSHFHLGPGQQLDTAKIDEGLKALYATGLFQDVRITQLDGHIVVHVVEAPVIDHVAFEGNRRVKDNQLSGELQSKPRGPFSRALVQADVQRILEDYRRSGRYDVSVEPKIIERADNRVDLVFEINEGQRTSVREIDFAGNRAFSDRRLKDVIKTDTTNLLSFFKNNDTYDPDRLEADADLLRRFYLKHGYADVQIGSPVARFDATRKGFVITFTIDEGELYHFGIVNVRTNLRDIDPATLRGQLIAQSGNVYNAESIETTVDQLTVEASKRGYAFAHVRPRPDRSPAARTINVDFVLEEGPPTYVERINIRGNTVTRDYVIRREFDIGEGDAYNRALIDRAERRLKNLNFFKSVKITTEPGSAPDRIIVNVNVEEQQTGEFSISGGYSTQAGPLAEVGIGERNLLGTGVYVKAMVTYGEYVRGFDLNAVEPYLLGNHMSLGIDVFAKDNLVSSYQSYGSDLYGATIQLGTPLTEQLSTQWRYSLYNESLSLSPALMACSPTNPPPGCYATPQASDVVKQAALNGPAWVSSIGDTVTYNTLDNNKDPKNGLRVDLKQDVAGLGGDANFLRTTGDVRYYHELTDDMVGMTRMQGGYIAPWGGQQVPFLNSFFGGPQLVRGFAPNGFGPRDVTPGTTMDNVGGTKYWATTAEVDAPVPTLPSQLGLKFAMFADAGSVWGYSGQTTFPNSVQPFQLDNSKMIRSSIGMGLIWDSPFGPLRADYAVALTKDSHDVLQPFRFSAGGF